MTCLGEYEDIRHMGIWRMQYALTDLSAWQLNTPTVWQKWQGWWGKNQEISTVFLVGLMSRHCTECHFFNVSIWAEEIIGAEFQLKTAAFHWYLCYRHIHPPTSYFTSSHSLLDNCSISQRLACIKGQRWQTHTSKNSDLVSKCIRVIVHHNFTNQDLTWTMHFYKYHKWFEC